MRHDGAVESTLGSGSSHSRSRPGYVNCVVASPHCVTAVGKLLTLTCFGGNCPSLRLFIHLWLSSNCGMSVVSNKQILSVKKRDFRPMDHFGAV